MQGEAREMSVMFCDVHNFTAISERLSPAELAELLNTLLSPLTLILHRHEAVIDKYIGDAIMAFWGAPVDDPHHAANAVAAAFEIQEALVEIRKDFKARGWPEIRMGIGINTGPVIVGNMGSTYRIAYTVIGDAVNLASRLQDLTRVYNARIIVGENTRRAFPAATYRELGLVQVKGKDELARIFEPSNPAMDPASTIVANMHRHNEALRCYQTREWDQASELFALLKESNPEDPLYDYYLARIATFRDTPPPEDWQGEIRYTIH
jgi:adenylate cyclase